jgi:mono/diheme cytochrome c family protein
MSDNKKNKYFIFIICTMSTFTIVGLSFYFVFASDNVETAISLQYKKGTVVELGRSIYSENCASCHGAKLEGQANWRQRNAAGYLPAPPHDETGHTWHHSDAYLFAITKYGIEKMINKSYPNNMPAYEGKLNNDEIIAVLSYIKSTWPNRIILQHDQINARAKTQ